jgi:hypothetical protein
VHALRLPFVCDERGRTVPQAEVRRDGNRARQRHDVGKGIDDTERPRRDAEFFFELAEGGRSSVGVGGIDEAARKRDLAGIAAQMRGTPHEDDGRLVAHDDGNDDRSVEHVSYFLEGWGTTPQTSGIVRRSAYAFDVAAIVAAVIVRTVSPKPAWIERHYANGAYPVIDRTVRAFTGALPFCLGDVLFIVALAWLGRFWFVRLRAAAPRARLGAGLRAALRTSAVLCLIFIWFMLSWAYNYGRVPLAEKIPVHDARTDENSVAAFGDRTTDRLSRLAPAAHRETASDAEVGRLLVPTFEATIQRLGDRAAFAPPRIKPTIFQPTLQLSATTGFTDPWTHEVNLDASLFPIERPAVYAHEWAHVSGFADEAEANFISVIACTTSHDPLLEYSGWLLVWENLPQDVHLTHRMGRMAYDDIMAIRARYRKNVNAQVEGASRVAYDRYLKSNRVKAGYASYRLFIRWMTGADFDRAGLPLVRPAGASAN